MSRIYTERLPPSLDSTISMGKNKQTETPILGNTATSSISKGLTFFPKKNLSTVRGCFCYIHSSPCEENAGPRSLGVLKTYFTSSEKEFLKFFLRIFWI